MYKIDKTLINNMNLNRSCIVITPKETIPKDEKILLTVMDAEEEEQLPPAVREKARELMQDAQEKAQRLVQDAQAEGEQIREEARREGYEAGFSEGRQKAAAELQTRSKEIKDALSRIEDYRQNLYRMLESDVLALAMDVAEKIINIHIERDDKVFKDIINKAVMGVKRSDDFSLYISKEDYNRYFKDDWLSGQAQGKSVEVVSDGGLPKGSCIIEADNEILDAGIPVQIGKIKQFLSEQVE